jgi:hypothetical protein
MLEAKLVPANKLAELKLHIESIRGAVSTHSILRYASPVLTAMIMLIDQCAVSPSLYNETVISSHVSALRHCLRFHLGKSTLSESLDKYIQLVKPSINSAGNEKYGGTAIQPTKDDYKQERRMVEEQRYLDNIINASSEKPLIAFLFNCWAYSIQEKRPSKKFFVSYAWPKNHDDPHNESWSKFFIARLVHHMILSGMQVYLDQYHSGPGKLLGSFMGKISDEARCHEDQLVLEDNQGYEIDHVMVVSSRTLVEKLSNSESGCYCEHSIINKRLINERGNRFIIPILINLKNYLPESLSSLVGINFCQQAYLDNIRDLFKIINKFNQDFFDWYSQKVKNFRLGMDVYIVSGLREKYLSPDVANLRCFLYQDSVPIQKSFVNLALVKSEEHQDKEKQYTLQSSTAAHDQKLDKYENIYNSNDLISLEDLPGRLNQKLYDHIFIEGRPGSGKSLLMQYFAVQWAINFFQPGTKIKWLSKYDAVVYLPLRLLLEFPECTDLSQFIYLVCFNEDYQDRLSPDLIKQGLTNNPNISVLYILDGLEEVLPLLNQKGNQATILYSLLKLKYWILSSRTRCIDSALLGDIRYVESIGFLDDDIKHYVKQFFLQRDGLTPQEQTIKTHGLLKVLSSNEDIKSLAHIPINLEFICSIWEAEQTLFEGSSFSITMTSLYEKILVLILRRYLLRLQELRILDNKVNIRHFTDEMIINHPKCKAPLAFLQELAWLTMQSQSLLIRPEVIRQLLGRHFSSAAQDESFVENLFRHLFILKPTGSIKRSPIDQVYYFIHFTFQEFLSAKYCTKLLIDDNRIGLESRGEVNFDEFIAEVKLIPKYEYLLVFFAGVVSLLFNQKIRIHFGNVLSNGSIDNLGVYELALLMQCLGESGDNIVYGGLYNKLCDYIMYLLYESKDIRFSLFSDILRRYPHILNNRQLQDLFFMLFEHSTDHTLVELVKLFSDVGCSNSKLIEAIRRVLSDSARSNLLRVECGKLLIKQNILRDDEKNAIDTILASTTPFEMKSLHALAIAKNDYQKGVAEAAAQSCGAAAGGAIERALLSMFSPTQFLNITESIQDALRDMQRKMNEEVSRSVMQTTNILLGRPEKNEYIDMPVVDLLERYLSKANDDLLMEIFKKASDKKIAIRICFVIIFLYLPERVCSYNLSLQQYYLIRNRLKYFVQSKGLEYYYTPADIYDEEDVSLLLISSMPQHGHVFVTEPVVVERDSFEKKNERIADILLNAVNNKRYLYIIVPISKNHYEHGCIIVSKNQHKIYYIHSQNLNVDKVFLDNFNSMYLSMEINQFERVLPRQQLAEHEFGCWMVGVVVYSVQAKENPDFSCQIDIPSCHRRNVDFLNKCNQLDKLVVQARHFADGKNLKIAILLLNLAIEGHIRYFGKTNGFLIDLFNMQSKLFRSLDAEEEAYNCLVKNLEILDHLFGCHNAAYLRLEVALKNLRKDIDSRAVKKTNSSLEIDKKLILPQTRLLTELVTGLQDGQQAVGMLAAPPINHIIEVREKLDIPDVVKVRLGIFVPTCMDLGTAKSKGDALFDAIAQALNQLYSDEKYTVNSLRLMCFEYVKDDKAARWVKEKLEKTDLNFQCGNYVARIGFNAEQMKVHERDKTLIGGVVSGCAKIEARIICGKLKIKLHLIEIKDNDKNPNDPIIAEYIVTGDEYSRIKGMKQDEYVQADIIHLVKYKTHYVPLVYQLKQQSTISRLQNADTQWYTDDEVKLLMEYYLKEKIDLGEVKLFYPINPNQNNSQIMGGLFNENALQEALLISQDVVPPRLIVLPINLGHIPVNLSASTVVGSHWTLLMLHFPDIKNRTNPNIFYFDSLGRMIPVSIDRILRATYEKADTIIPLSEEQIQDDGYNCGPWVVEAARYLVLTGAILNKDYSDRIAKSRLEHRVVLQEIKSKTVVDKNIDQSTSKAATSAALLVKESSIINPSASKLERLVNKIFYDLSSGKSFSEDKLLSIKNLLKDTLMSQQAAFMQYLNSVADRDNLANCITNRIKESAKFVKESIVVANEIEDGIELYLESLTKTLIAKERSAIQQ